MTNGAASADKLLELCGPVGLEAVTAHRDWEAFGLPVAGGVEDQPARTMQLITIFGGESARIEKKNRDRNGTKP